MINKVIRATTNSIHFLCGTDDMDADDVLLTSDMNITGRTMSEYKRTFPPHTVDYGLQIYLAPSNTISEEVALQTVFYFHDEKTAKKVLDWVTSQINKRLSSPTT